jgi:FAD/FMN-containing dehydrogenase
MIKLDLEINEVNYILQTLGELPTKTGAWELLRKIKDQADPQVPAPTEETKQ